MGITSELKIYLNSDEFQNPILKQYRRFEILSEAGLRTAVVNQLNKKIKCMGKRAESYRVTCEPVLKSTKIRPDILIWTGKNPRIWIELKDTFKFNQESADKDWEKLKKYYQQYTTIKNWYLIYASRSGEGQLKNLRKRDTMRSWLIKIDVRDFIERKEDFDLWNEEFIHRAHYEYKK